MCGLTGFISAYCRTEGMAEIVRSMSGALTHRGPDDEGVWVDGAAGVALGHRRLSIIDLSPAGHQPMVSASGRYIIVFNGEIYNHLMLRDEIGQTDAAVKWRGHSDTETLLSAFEAWGIETALKKTVGMFALALWDRQARMLTLARDRMGEKPLYYGWQGRSFMFASELKALHAHPDFKGYLNRDALAAYLRFNYVPAPFSIFDGVYKLKPGTYLQLSAESSVGTLPEGVAYWRMQDAAAASRFEFHSEHDAVAALDGHLRRAVAGQMLADVPVGAFLSGGIDSSTIVALMQAQSSFSVRTFSIGFHEAGYNEAENAKAVARYLGTDHTELYVTSTQIRDVIPRLPEIYDEPFADSSQLPTFLIAQMTRRHVAVSLSGDGGDELFGGYNRYFWAQSIWNNLQRFPLLVRSFAEGAVLTVPPAAWSRLFRLVSSLFPVRLRHANVGDKVHKAAELLTLERPEKIYLKLVSLWADPNQIVLGGNEPKSAIVESAAWNLSANFMEQMMYLDAITYLPDDILVKVDRVAMAVSLETRVPFLDHRVVEFAWTLPLSMKVRGGQGKWILRQVLDQYVPRELMARPKMGFGAPIDQWLRGPLRDWAEEMLGSRRLEQDGYFDPIPVREKWGEHLSGKRNWQHMLWGVLMFQAWLDRWK